MEVTCLQLPVKVEVIQVVHVVAARGSGRHELDPVRHVDLYYDMGGNLLACFDPVNGYPSAVNISPFVLNLPGEPPPPAAEVCPLPGGVATPLPSEE